MGRMGRRLLERVALGIAASYKGVSVADDYGWHGAGLTGGGILPGSEQDWERKAGDLWRNSTVSIATKWRQDTFAEARLYARRKQADGTYVEIPNHPLVALLANPMPGWYSGSVEEAAVDLSLTVDGNAYLYTILSGAQKIVGLQYVPHDQIEPKGGGEDGWIGRYVFNGGKGPQDIPPDRIVHLRDGAIDPHNQFKSLSRLGALLREVCTANELSTFYNGLLHHSGLKHLFASPKALPDGKQGIWTDDQRRGFKKLFREAVTPDHAPDPITFSIPLDITTPGFSPSEMDMGNIALVPIGFICAAIGVGAVVLDLPSNSQTFCLPAESRVWTPHGLVRIADVQPGEEVWSFADGGIVRRSVNKSGRTGHKSLLEIRTKNRILHATGNHPILTRVPGSMTDGNNAERRVRYEWKPAEDLNVGDCIVQIKRLPDCGGTSTPGGTPSTPDLMQFLGALVGDGTVVLKQHAGAVIMSMPPETDRCAAHYLDLTSALFTSKQSKRGQVCFRTGDRYFTVHSKVLAATLAAWGFGGRAHTKRVPGWVFGLRRDLRVAFLAGLVDSDGYIDKRGALSFTFCNEDLTHDVRALLVSVGIQCCNVRHQEFPASCLPQHGVRESYASYTFTASATQLVSEIPFADPLYRKRVDNNLQRHRSDGFDGAKTGLSDDLGFYEIKSIRELPAEDVYDIEVEGGHSFIAEGVVVHNSNKKEARQDAYNNCKQFHRAKDQQLTERLMPVIVGAKPGDELARDYSNVQALQEDTSELFKRGTSAVGGPWLTPNEQRVAVGLPPIEGGDVLYPPRGLSPALSATDTPGPELEKARELRAMVGARWRAMRAIASNGHTHPDGRG